MASKIFRRGFSASSESVEIPSKPMYVNTAMEVAAEHRFRVPQLAIIKRTQEKIGIVMGMSKDVMCRRQEK